SGASGFASFVSSSVLHGCRRARCPAGWGSTMRRSIAANIVRSRPPCADHTVRLLAIGFPDHRRMRLPLPGPPPTWISRLPSENGGIAVVGELEACTEAGRARCRGAPRVSEHGTPNPNGPLFTIVVPGAVQGDNTFSVPGASGCGPNGDGSLNGAVNAIVGLPSPSGANHSCWTTPPRRWRPRTFSSRASSSLTPGISRSGDDSHCDLVARNTP